MVEEVANFLGSPDVAVDVRHGPKLYSRFLKGLLETPLAHVDHSPSALKRSMKPLAPVTPSSDSRPGSSSPMPPTPVHVPAPPLPQQSGVKEEQRFAQMEPRDSQMFEGLDLGYAEQQGQPINAAELYSPPLPFDHELLQEMQTLTDPNWSNMVMPGQLCSLSVRADVLTAVTSGFNWMDAMQDPDIQMRFNADYGAPSQQ